MKVGMFSLSLGTNIVREKMNLGKRRILLNTCEFSWAACPLSLLSLSTLMVIKMKCMTASPAEADSELDELEMPW